MSTVQKFIPFLASRNSRLNSKLTNLHERILANCTHIGRVSIAIHESEADVFKIFMNREHAVADEVELCEVLIDNPVFLNEVLLGKPVIIDDLVKLNQHNSSAWQWLSVSGYQSVYIQPLYYQNVFFGIIMFASLQTAGFSAALQRELAMFSDLVNLFISEELNSFRTIAASAKIAKDFMNLRNIETGSHLDRMASYSKIIANCIAGLHDLSKDFVENVYLFAPLHDIGKIGIADSILLKPGKLDQEQRMIMDSHVPKGVKIVKKILSDFALQHVDNANIMLNIVGCHHELLDGSGYPNQLKGAEIPIEARIVTVADIFDALTSKRPYKEVWTTQQAYAELKKMVADGKLDADCVAAIDNNLEEIEAIRMNYQDTELLLA